MICPLRKIFTPALPGGSAAQTLQCYRIGHAPGCWLYACDVTGAVACHERTCALRAPTVISTRR